MCNCIWVHLLMIPLLRMTIDFAFTQWNGISWKTVSTKVLMNSFESCVKWVNKCSYSIHFIFYNTFQLFWEEIELVSFFLWQFSFLPYFLMHTFSISLIRAWIFHLFDLFVSIHILNFSTREVTYGRTSKSKSWKKKFGFLVIDRFLFLLSISISIFRSKNANNGNYFNITLRKWAVVVNIELFP